MAILDIQKVSDSWGNFLKEEAFHLRPMIRNNQEWLATEKHKDTTGGECDQDINKGVC